MPPRRRLAALASLLAIALGRSATAAPAQAEPPLGAVYPAHAAQAAAPDGNGARADHVQVAVPGPRLAARPRRPHARRPTTDADDPTSGSDGDTPVAGPSGHMGPGRRGVAARPAAAAAPADGGDDDGEVESLDVEDVAPVSAGDDWFGDAYPQMDRVLDVTTARPARRGAFNTIIQHRGAMGALRSPFYDLLGLDPGGLKVGLGVRYGVIDTVDLGIYRINGVNEAFDTYELSGRWQLLVQARHRLDLLVHGGLSWFTAPGNQVVAPFVQVIGNRLVGNRALLGAGLLAHVRSTGPDKGQLDPGYSLATHLQLDIRLVDSWSLAMELTYALAGYREIYPVITIGPKFISNRHTFAFIASNSQYVDAAGIVANTWRIGPLDWILGFHITREI